MINLNSLKKAILKAATSPFDYQWQKREAEESKPDLWQGIQVADELDAEWLKSPERLASKAKMDEWYKNYKPELTSEGRPCAPDGWDGPWPPKKLTAEKKEEDRKRIIQEQEDHMRRWGFER